MMDRAVGMLNKTTTGIGRGSIYYQYGRKDPIPGNVTLYNIAGTAITTTAPIDFKEQQYRVTGAPSGTTIAGSVKRPMNFWGSTGEWSNFVNSFWNDAVVPASPNLAKSIYDPCPPGWIAPIKDVFIDFRSGVTVNNPSRGLPTYSTRNGITYFPNIDPVTADIFFANLGFSVGGSMPFTNDGRFWYANNSGNYWMAGNALNHGNGHAETYQVRCVSVPPQP